jgi:hypothetical protein
MPTLFVFIIFHIESWVRPRKTYLDCFLIFTHPHPAREYGHAPLKPAIDWDGFHKLFWGGWPQTNTILPISASQLAGIISWPMVLGFQFSDVKENLAFRGGCPQVPSSLFMALVPVDFPAVTMLLFDFWQIGTVLLLVWYVSASFNIP